jgi:hypothetical protein
MTLIQWVAVVRPQGVCRGTNAPPKYRCEILPSLHGDFIRLPYWADLKLFKVNREIECGTPGETIRAYYPDDDLGPRLIPAIKARRPISRPSDA